MLAVVREQRPYELVERRLVAARDDARGHRGDRGRSGNVHRQRDLAEELAGAKDPSLAERRLGNGRDAREQDEEAIAGLALPDEHGSGRHLFPLHAVGEGAELLAGELGEEPDTGELRHGCRYVARRHAQYRTHVGVLAGWRLCPRCGADLAHGDGCVECAACGFVHYANPAPAVSALVLDDAGRVLLGRRAVEPDVGLWDTLGGFLEDGEDALTALHRELREEAGIEVEVGAFVGTFPDRYGDAEDAPPNLNLVWEASIASGTPTPDDDVSELRWFAPDELPSEGELAFRWLAACLPAWAKTRR